MRLIVDANQASAIEHLGAGPELVLPAYVLAEILLCPNPGPILEKFTELGPRLGLEPAAAFDAIATLNEAGIRDFEPFASSKFVYSAKTLGQAKRIARVTKLRHFGFCGSMFEKRPRNSGRDLPAAPPSSFTTCRKPSLACRPSRKWW